MTDDDDELTAELQRRLDRDTGIRYSLEQVLFECGLSLNDLEPDTPRRVWVSRPGNWCNPNYLKGRSAPLVFLGGDEFGNRPVCLRLPGHRLLCLNLRVPLRRELYEPEEDTA